MPKRINVYASDANEPRIRAVCDRHHIPVSNLLEAVALCMTDAEIADLKERHRQMRRVEKGMADALDDQVLSRLRGMTPSQLETVIKAIDAAQTL
ncbi:hypothetical protein C7444_115108 [Sphaerotilus hippei]|uniref:Uncharacterized protein n=1 Tax=Sphaerotilus hippei TaxID=744406 RepID=A0A318GWY7_9BURK|nr:hypothetical protein [Sphaerotilus hippei]PXW94213.1 hypothetical protein C7444_115108 [Sphaerotilus hippei]